MNTAIRSRATLLLAGLSVALWGCADDRDSGIEGIYGPPGSNGAPGDDGGDGGGDGGDDGSGTADDGGSGGDGGNDGGGDSGGDDGSGTGGDGGTTEDQPPDESPYEGGWDIGDCQDSIQGTATSPQQAGVGSVLLDWNLPDQFGEQVRLYDFCHKVIYYVVVTEW